MDAVPGTPTTLWFTPIITTEEMKKKTGNPDFVYEISCDQMCGKGHFTMRGIVVVETQKENNREKAPDNCPNNTRDKELPWNHFMILAEYVFGNKRLLVVLMWRMPSGVHY